MRRKWFPGVESISAVCSGCGCTFEKNIIYKNHANRCKACYAAKSRKQNKDPKRKKWIQNYHYKRLYGINYEEVERLKELQNNQCAICKDNSKRLVIDHCHATKKVRELVCDHCNYVLGHSKENLEILKETMNYITKHAVLLNTENG